MSESTVYALSGLLAGVLVGVVCTLIFNKVRGGSVSPGKVKRELEDYQAQVEAHFDETSDKFRAMAEQYKDLYQHLSVGATTLCRPDHIVPGLTDESNPLGANKQLSDQSSEAAASTSAKADPKADPKAEKDAPVTETKKSTGDVQAAPGNAGKEAAKKAPAQANSDSAAKAAAAADEKSHASASAAGQTKPGSAKPKQKPV